jgi:hypothetical protein
MKSIRIIKTWHGLRYGIVNLNTKPVFSPKGKLLYKSKEIDVLSSESGPLLFSYNKEGLQKAKEVLNHK